MTISLKHAFTSGKAAGSDATRVYGTHWDAEHTLTQATGKLLGRTSAGTGATEEITPTSAFTLSSSSLDLTDKIVADGPIGSATVAPIITFNAKGQLTTVTSATITPAVGSITGLGTGVAAFLATPSSVNLATAITDETGSGALVFATSPALVTPALGVATGTSLALGGATIGTHKLAAAGSVLLTPPAGTPYALGIVTTNSDIGLFTSQTGPASGSGAGLSYNSFNVGSDNYAASSVVNGLYVGYFFGGSNLTGARQGFSVNTTFTATSSASNTSRNYVAVQGNQNVNTADTGTNTGAGAAGAFFGSNFGVQTTAAAAVNLAAVVGCEVDVSMIASSTARDVLGFSAVKLSGTGAAGARNDAAFQVGCASGVTPWTNGFWVSRTANGTQPIATTGVVIGSDSAVSGGSAMTMGSFADFHLDTFSNDIFYFNNFRVTGAGNVTDGTWQADVVAGLYGGTGLSTAAVGDIIYASATTPTWSRLADVAVGSVLASGGVNTAPAWSATPTLTSLTAPTIVGGTAAGSSLTLQATSNVSPSGDSVQIKIGGANLGQFAVGGLQLSANVQVSVTAITYSDTAVPLSVVQRARGTSSAPTKLLSGDVVGQFGFKGYDGSGAFSGSQALLRAVTLEDWNDATHRGTAFVFMTTPAASGTIGQAAKVWGSTGFSVGTDTDPGAGLIYQNSASFLMRTKTTWNNGAAAGAGTITNAPAAGNPTKWVPIDDNGTTRYIPAW